MLRAARRNFLSIWEEKDFEYQFFSARIMSRSNFVCNSPDTVVRAFIDRHHSFERRTPQMRHALKPLLDEGLFISDAATLGGPSVCCCCSDGARVAFAAVRADNRRSGRRESRALASLPPETASMRCAKWQP